MSFSRYSLLLSYPSSEYLNRILTVLEEEVKSCGQHVDRAEKSSGEGYLNAVIDDECGMIEELIGIAFLVAQIQINQTVSHIKKLHEFARKENPTRILRTTTGAKENILQFGNSQFKNTYGFSKIKVINTIADYYKHKDEPQLGEAISQVFRAIGCMDLCIEGCNRISTGNFRQAAKVLEVGFDAMGQLTKILEEWQGELRMAYKEELISVGLIPETRNGTGSGGAASK